MLTVGLDARATEVGFKAHFGRGIGRYAEELIKHLKLLSNEPEWADIQCKTLGKLDSHLSPFEQKIQQILPLGRTTFESQVLYPRCIARAGMDLVHFFSHGDAPVYCAVPRVVTVLDLIPLRFPDLYRADKTSLRFKFARCLEHQAARSAAGILSISECTKRDVVELLGVAEDKILVTPLAADSRFGCSSFSSEERLRQQTLSRNHFGMDLDRPVLLYVGGIDPRKNILFLLRVLHEIIQFWPQAIKPQLILAGRYEHDDQYPKVVSEIARLKLKPHVKLLGYVAEDELPLLYSSAEIFVFPSLYEGFGLPVLEAMACATPVVAANNSSIPEVAGDCAVLCMDNQLQHWTASIIGLLEDEQHRLTLASAGVERAKKFSWQQTARLTAQAYRQFAGRSS